MVRPTLAMASAPPARAFRRDTAAARQRAAAYVRRVLAGCQHGTGAGHCRPAPLRARAPSTESLESTSNSSWVVLSTRSGVDGSGGASVATDERIERAERDIIRSTATFGREPEAWSAAALTSEQLVAALASRKESVGSAPTPPEPADSRPPGPPRSSALVGDLASFLAHVLRSLVQAGRKAATPRRVTAAVAAAAALSLLRKRPRGCGR